jgi:hypothetical protein
VAVAPITAIDGKEHLGSEQQLRTNPKGELTLSLADNLSPNDITSVRLDLGDRKPDRSLDSALGSDEPRKLQPNWAGPWIIQTVPVREGDQRIHEVHLRVADLAVRLEPWKEMPAGVMLEVKLRRTAPKEPYYVSESVAVATTRTGTPGQFRGLQAGQYVVSVRGEGVANYDSLPITMQDININHPVKLEPGRTVRGTAIYPDGRKMSLTLMSILLRDGVEISRESIDEWKGLGFARYTARIRSTREWEAEAMREGFPASRIAKEDRIKGCEVSFTINRSTPEMLDLGEIKILPEKP